MIQELRLAIVLLLQFALFFVMALFQAVGRYPVRRIVHLLLVPLAYLLCIILLPLLQRTSFLDLPPDGLV